MASCVDKLNSILDKWDAFKKNPSANVNWENFSQQASIDNLRDNMEEGEESEESEEGVKEEEEEDEEGEEGEEEQKVQKQEKGEEQVLCKSNVSDRNGCNTKMREFGSKLERAILHYNTKCSSECDYNKNKCVVNKFQCGREGQENLKKNKNNVEEQLKKTQLYTDKEIEEIIKDNEPKTKILQHMN